MVYKKSVNTQYDLVQLNKETIRYMIESLKQTRQPDPPEPNFKESIGDSAIENMDELLQQQLKQRELDVSHFAGMPNRQSVVDLSIRKDIEELHRILKLLQDEITLIKSKLPADTKEVT